MRKRFKFTAIFYALGLVLLSVSVSRIWVNLPKPSKSCLRPQGLAIKKSTQLIRMAARRVNGKEVGGRVVGGQFQIFKTDLNGGKPKQLTYHGHNIQADWFDSEALPVQPNKMMLTTLWAIEKEII